MTWPSTPARSAAVAVLVLLAACSASGSDDASPTTTVARPTTTESIDDTTTEPDTTEPAGPTTADCLETGPVSAMLGSPVERGPSVGIKVSTDGTGFTTNGCEYTLTEGEGSVTIGRISTDEDSTDPVFDALATAAEADAASDGFGAVDGIGDDAIHDGPRVAVLSGDHMIFVEFDTDFDADTDALLTALDDGEALAGTVVAKLDPTATGSALCDSAKASVADEVKVTDTIQSGGSIGFDDLTITTEGCSMDLDDGRKLRISVADGKDWDAYVEAKSSSPFSTSFERLSIGEFSAFDDGSALIVDDGDEPLEVETQDLGLEPAGDAALRVKLAEAALSA